MKEKRNGLFCQFRITWMVVCVMLIGGLGISSCDRKDDPEPLPETLQQTVFMYFPWSNLLYFFNKNISDLERAIEQHDLSNTRVMVFISTSTKEATLFEIIKENGKCVRSTVKEYTNPLITTEAGITAILNDVKASAPALRYGMIIGCHGMGWIPASADKTRKMNMKYHWEYGDLPRTRWFGVNGGWETDVVTLAQAIRNVNLKMEYILFDDCYMSSVEAIYDLRDVTDYFIACPTEVLADGMPYAKIGSYLLGNVNYEEIRNVFIKHYTSGTIAVTVCSELDRLATIMKEINKNNEFDSSLESLIQPMDGYSPGLFFDYGDYVARLCKDQNLLKEFERQLERAVPSNYKGHCGKYPTNVTDPLRHINIKTYSGITTSDPSRNYNASSKTQTAWYKATH